MSARVYQLALILLIGFIHLQSLVADGSDPSTKDDLEKLHRQINIVFGFVLALLILGVLAILCLLYLISKSCVYKLNRNHVGNEMLQQEIV